MSLNPKQSRFVEEYLIDLNATQAAIRAGYSAKSAKEVGSRLLTYAHVRAAIDEAQRERTKSSGLTADWVIDKLRQLATDCSDRTSETYNPQAANRSLELLAKHLGLLVDRQDVTVRTIDQLEAADIERELAELDAADQAGKRSGAKHGDAIH